VDDVPDQDIRVEPSHKPAPRFLIASRIS
jgi:hypothetical protein